MTVAARAVRAPRGTALSSHPWPQEAAVRMIQTNLDPEARGRAIADWPILNALVNTAAGAIWVSVHHGGGVGIGNSIHAGMVCVADGTPLAREKLRRVLTTDPGTGVLRHADAGYPQATATAAEAGLDLPSVTDRSH